MYNYYSFFHHLNYLHHTSNYHLLKRSLSKFIIQVLSLLDFSHKITLKVFLIVRLEQLIISTDELLTLWKSLITTTTTTTTTIIILLTGISLLTWALTVEFLIRLEFWVRFCSHLLFLLDIIFFIRWVRGNFRNDFFLLDALKLLPQ